jgi:hypothetical protein
MIHSSTENFKPGIPIVIGTNSEQKVDEMHVSPSSYRQCDVSGSWMSSVSH